MKDRKGHDLAVGDRAYVIPDKYGVGGGACFVRKFTVRRNSEQARVDDGPADMGDDLSAANPDAWSWSAWVAPKEIEKI